MKSLIAITLTLIFGGAMLTMTTSSIEPSITNAKGAHHSGKGVTSTPQLTSLKRLQFCRC